MDDPNKEKNVRPFENITAVVDKQLLQSIVGFLQLRRVL